MNSVWESPFQRLEKTYKARIRFVQIQYICLLVYAPANMHPHKTLKCYTDHKKANIVP